MSPVFISREVALEEIKSRYFLQVILLPLFFFVRGSTVPGYTVGGTGIIPAAVILFASATVLVLVSLVTPPPERAVLTKFFPGA